MPCGPARPLVSRFALSSTRVSSRIVREGERRLVCHVIAAAARRRLVWPPCRCCVLPPPARRARFAASVYVALQSNCLRMNLFFQNANNVCVFYSEAVYLYQPTVLSCAQQKTPAHASNGTCHRKMIIAVSLLLDARASAFALCVRRDAGRRKNSKKRSASACIRNKIQRNVGRPLTATRS